MRSLTTLAPGAAGLALVALLAALSACGGDDDAADGVVLSPAAEAGRQIARDSGCAACHGSNGGGGAGPAWTDLYGATVELDDDTTVTADDAYLAESITDPRAKVVDGYAAPMPDNDLDQQQIASVIEYIKALSPSAAPGSQP